MNNLTKLFIKKYPELAPFIGNIPKNNRRDDLFRIRDEISRLIRNFKHENKSNNDDHLAKKLSRYGNEGYWAKEQLELLNRMIFNENKVDSIAPGSAISVEIECIFNNENRYNQFISLVKQAGIKKHVQVKSDGSIDTSVFDGECESCGYSGGNNCDDCNSSEIAKEVVVTFDKTNPAPLKLVCKFLAETKAFVNRSCGLHVHFDMRDKSASQVAVIARKIAKIVPMLKLILPESRRNNRYCSKDISHRSDRYAFVNKCSFQKHGTLEIRGHSGTTDYVKIINWIRIINLIIAAKPVKADKFFEMLVEINCPNDLYDYCKERYYKFGSNSVEGLPQQLVAEVTNTEISETVAA